MATLLHQFVIGVPRAAAIWTGLLLLTLGVLTALVVRSDRDRRREPALGGAVDADGAAPDRAAPTARSAGTTESADVAGPAATAEQIAAAAAEAAADLRRYAGEVAVAAAGAARNARRRRASWLAAQEHLDRAWRERDEADRIARRFAGAGALPALRPPYTPAERAARKRYLHRAAVMAHWRGDLTVPQLRDVFAGRGGWDPRRHPVEQEVLLARAVRDAKLARYRQAVVRERAAWRDADLSAEAARVLAVEAYAAAQRLSPAVAPAAATSAQARRTVLAARFRPARVG
ncbi:hypothetical protein [Micromonospora fluostatini]|uniref:hypothetical protein n=1 Tax=Micromonospora sp. JCM 30529 TaxID=3421643 RepID=UPI003D175E6F